MGTKNERNETQGKTKADKSAREISLALLQNENITNTDIIRKYNGRGTIDAKICDVKVTGCFARWNMLFARVRDTSQLTIRERMQNTFTYHGANSSQLKGYLSAK